MNMSMKDYNEKMKSTKISKEKQIILKNMAKKIDEEDIFSNKINITVLVDVALEMLLNKNKNEVIDLINEHKFLKKVKELDKSWSD